MHTTALELTLIVLLAATIGCTDIGARYVDSGSPSTVAETTTPSPDVPVAPPGVDTAQAVDTIPSPADVDDDTNPLEPPRIPQSASLWVVANDNTTVGLLVSRKSELFSSLEIYDLATVYDPTSGLFFTVGMTTGEVMVPQKILFSEGGCEGTVVVRALCDDCYSGYDFGFVHDGTWYRLVGGQLGELFSYESYLQPGFDEPCGSHTGDTYVYPTETVDDAPPSSFAPPLRFVFGAAQ